MWFRNVFIFVIVTGNASGAQTNPAVSFTMAVAGQNIIILNFNQEFMCFIFILSKTKITTSTTYFNSLYVEKLHISSSKIIINISIYLM